MKKLHDFQQNAIRLTAERLAHILEHPEMVGMEDAIEATLLAPQYVIQSRSDEQARLYYRHHENTRVGDKYVCVVVKFIENDAFVLTAHLTDTVKKGEQRWLATS